MVHVLIGLHWLLEIGADGINPVQSLLDAEFPK